MIFSNFRQHKFFRPAAAAASAVLVGLFLWATNIGDAWTNASYDYLFRFSRFSVTNQVVVILMDNEAYSKLGQNRGQAWDRSIHAKLFNKLADDGAVLVAPDIQFRKLGDATADAAMAAALQRLTNVVMAADQSSITLSGVDSASALPPLDLFLKAAGNNWGVTWLDHDSDWIIRRHWPFPSPGPYPSFSEKVATTLGARLDRTPTEKWIRYYDPNKAWVSMSYHLGLLQSPGYFRGKIVFIGNKPAMSKPDAERDKFQVPQTRWTGEAVGGVEILVTQFLNLLNGDWLRRMKWPAELFLLFISGLMAGGLSLLRRTYALVLAGVGALVLICVGVGLSEFTHYWFPWLIVAGGQLPCALVWALIHPKPAVTIPLPAPSSASGKTIVLSFPEEESPDAPDFELFQPPIGQGGYGKVWIVRNAIGQWQALKAVYQSKFGDNTRPYEAEFHGLQKFKPVSEKHPGLLRIELISKMKSEGYFYYVMELGDAQVEGWEKTPSSYRPRDLDNMRKQAEGRRLPAEECLRIITFLADALNFLHGQGLIHRDIKPSNVIFVNNRPKLADIGLVADIRPPDYEHTLVGTPGYMPPMPERPGTIQADIYALGMVLYVISTGNSPAFYPEISKTLAERSGQRHFVRLDAIILRACHPDISLRYPTTDLMLKDLNGVT